VLSHIGIYVFFSLYLDSLGYSKTMIGVLWAVSVAVEIAFFWTQARWFARWNAQTWLLLAAGVAALRFAAMALLGGTDWRLALPIAVWFPAYALLLRVLVPRLRDRSRKASEARSLLTGRIVDSYTNIQTVKLFARARDSTFSHHNQKFLLCLKQKCKIL
jgi:ABC-type multidrug transport system fused ATPase/permease subunit